MQKERIYGFAGACLFCGLLFLFLYFTFIKTQIKTGEEGILVRFGTVDESAGTFDPREEPPQSVPEPQAPTPTPPVKETVKPQVPKPATRPTAQQQSQAKPAAPTITQNREETAAIAEARQKQKEQERIEAERRTAQAAAQAKAAEEQRKREAIKEQVSGALENASAQSQSGAAQTGAGTQGNSQSTSPVGASSGSSGRPEFNLTGRTSVGELHRPANPDQEAGTIVVEIQVDPKGNVINAKIRLKGTNIGNESMRRLAEEAARKDKFSSIEGNTNQPGTITYRYTLN